MTIQEQVALEWAKSPECYSELARDIAAKSARYLLSEKQFAVLVKIHAGMLTREADRLTRIAAGIAAPDGRQNVTGTIVKVVEGSNEFGFFRRVYLDLDNGAKVRGNAPSAAVPQAGQKVAFKATFKVSDRDSSSGYWSRPTNWTVQP